MKIELWGGGEAQICCRFVAIEAPTNMWLKVDFQNLSEIEIFRKSKDFGLIST